MKPKKGGLKSSTNRIFIDPTLAVPPPKEVPALGRPTPRLPPVQPQRTLEQTRRALIASLPAPKPKEPAPTKPRESPSPLGDAQVSSGKISCPPSAIRASAPPPTPAPVSTAPTAYRWVTVRWEAEHGCFDPTSLRLEPETCDFDAIHQPYTWPRVYLPNGLPRTSSRPPLTALELVAKLNDLCNWQTPRQKIADKIERYGGFVRFASVSFSREHTGDGVPDERFRKALSQRTKTRASAAQHYVLHQVIRREQQQHLPFPPPQEPHELVARTFQPVPVPLNYVSDARAHNVTEDEIREYVGLPTLQEQLVAQIEAACLREKQRQEQAQLQEGK